MVVKKWSLVAAWAAIVVLATTLTWQIVSAADEQVSDRPVAPLEVGAPLAATSDSTTSTTRPTSSPGSYVTTTPPDLTGSPSSTATTDAGSSTPTTTAPTTTSTIGWTVKTVSTAGGVVVFRVRPNEVVLTSATPAPGFAAEVKKSGPPEVEVEFEGEEAKYEVRARWHNGALDVESGGEVEED